MKKKRIEKRYRAFLNDHTTELGAISVWIGINPSGSVDASLQLSDCNRKIELAFGTAYEEVSIADRITKVRRIRKGLDMIEEALMDCLKASGNDAERINREGNTNKV